MILGVTAIPQMAIALLFEIGQIATGYVAVGQLAFGYYTLMSGRSRLACSESGDRDLKAVEFFLHLLQQRGFVYLIDLLKKR